MVEIADPLAAYLLDSAVVAVGQVLENALRETVTVGTGKTAETRPRYTLAQLLSPDFALPRPGRSLPNQHNAAAFLNRLGSGVKRWKEQVN